MSVSLPLSQGFVAIVDDEDAEAALGAGKWTALVAPHTVYAMRPIRRSDGRKTSTRLHNFLTGWQFVDHINGDGLDNRRANLRPATQATNGRNVGKRSHNTSGYKGVSWHTGSRKWFARIAADGRTTHLGLFSDPIAAALAYDAAALEIHGAFARTNFPSVEAAS